MKNLHDLNILKSVSDNPEAQTIIDDFINSKHKEYNDTYVYCYDNEKIVAFLNGTFNDFLKLSVSISSEFKIPQTSLILYFSLDKILYPIIDRKTSLIVKELLEINLPEVNKYTYEVDGRNIDRLCSNKESAIFNTLVSNFNLFPPSTKKYLKKKLDISKIADGQSLTNEFKARAFVSQFDDKFLKGKFDIVLKNILSSVSYSDKKKTLYHFHNAMYKKYSHKTGAELEFLNRFLADIFHNMHIYTFDSYSISEKDLLEIAQQIAGNQALCNSLARAVKCENYGHLNIISILALFVVDNKTLKDEHLERYLINSVSKYSLKDLFGFYQDSQQNKLYDKSTENIKKLFLKKHPNIHDFLKKEGYLEEEVLSA